VWGGGGDTIPLRVIPDGVIELAGSALASSKKPNADFKGKICNTAMPSSLSNQAVYTPNGISLIANLAARLPGGCATKLADGTTLGPEATLAPTFIYMPSWSPGLQAADPGRSLSVKYHRAQLAPKSCAPSRFQLCDRCNTARARDLQLHRRTNQRPAKVCGGCGVGAGYAVCLASRGGPSGRSPWLPRPRPQSLGCEALKRSWTEASRHQTT